MRDTVFTQPPPIAGITPFSLLDFPDMMSCILWFAGCNFCCKYCHNPELVRQTSAILPIEHVVNFLESRKGVLDGVVLSGGECTLFTHLPKFVRHIKTLGFAVKVDTNGTNPRMIDSMLRAELIDYIALDYKAPAHKYCSITQCGQVRMCDSQFEAMSSTLETICGNTCGVRYEVRTTVHTDLLDEGDINAIIEDLIEHEFTGTYYIQQYIHRKTLANMAEMQKPFDRSKILIPTKFAVRFRNFD